jgi:hypothetical protein
MPAPPPVATLDVAESDPEVVDPDVDVPVLGLPPVPVAVVARSLPVVVGSKRSVPLAWPQLTPKQAKTTKQEEKRMFDPSKRVATGAM